MTRLNARGSSSLQVRVAIAIGLVVVGDLLGEGAAQEQAVIGETPNLAARLQGFAEPNTVVVADNTRRPLKRTEDDPALEEGAPDPESKSSGRRGWTRIPREAAAFGYPRER